MPRHTEASHASRAARARRTFDGKTGQALGGTDYTSYQLDPLSDPTLAFDLPAGESSGPAELANPLPGTSVVPATNAPANALSERLKGIPWWVWAMLGLGAGYFIARQYGHKIGRALAPAG